MLTPTAPDAVSAALTTIVDGLPLVCAGGYTL